MSRFNEINPSQWPYLSPALRGLSNDLASVESLQPWNVYRVVYTRGAWPARPPYAAYVEWVDPTGQASAPSAAQPADTIVIGSTLSVAQFVAVEILPDAVRGISAGWEVNVGAPVIDFVAGTATVTNMTQSVIHEGVAVNPGTQLTLKVTPAAGSTGTFTGRLDFYDATDTKIGLGLTLTAGSVEKSGSMYVPALTSYVNIVVSGANATAAVIDAVSLKSAG